MEIKYGLIVASVSAVIGYFLGGYDTLISVFCTVLVLDTIIGMLKALYLGEYSSSKFRKGFLKKTAYMLAVILAVALDRLCGDSGMLRTACIGLFTANESISIVENLGQMGVPMPEKVIQAIEVLKGKQNN